MVVAIDMASAYSSTNWKEEKLSPPFFEKLPTRFFFSNKENELIKAYLDENSLQ